MSKNASTNIKMYNIHNINKKILAKPEKKRYENEIMGPLDRYRDENWKQYVLKKKQFLATAKNYYNLNKNALHSNKIKLEQLTADILQYEFTADVHHQDACIFPERKNITGRLLRKRSERKIHDEKEVNIEVCRIEPWFKRYLVLGRFIEAARKIILKNRLLKILEKLKSVDRETVDILEAGYKRFFNVSYPDLFENFIE